MKRYSILQKEMNECWFCGAKNNLHIHEAFFGTGKRALSIKYGCCVSLCATHHNLSNMSVHNNREMDLNLKKIMERKFKEIYPELDFIKIFGKSYL
jgi:hypothetical protein